jgi:hypothetical protein
MILEAIEMEFAADARTVVVLLPGADIRAVGGSVRSRNARVAARAGAALADAATLGERVNSRAVIVPPGVLINTALLTPLRRSTRPLCSKVIRAPPCS